MERTRTLVNVHWLLFLLILCSTASACAQGIVINAVGDIMLGGNGTKAFTRLGYDYPFAATLPMLKNGDITIGNLEAPITGNGQEFKEKRFRFKSDPNAAKALKNAGFNVLTLANNHMLDFGKIGLQATLQNLAGQGILSVGAGENLASARREAVITVRKKKIAFLAYSLTLPTEFYAGETRAGTAPAYASYYRNDIARAKAVADYVVVSFHWGTELSRQPKPCQVAVAHRAIEAGADLILGHHPHVLQGIERYKNGLIFYSLGNFAFASLSAASDGSVIARISLDGGVKEVELIPLNVLNREVRFQPQVATGTGGRKIIDHMNILSRQMGTFVINDDGRYLVRMERRLAQK